MPLLLILLVVASRLLPHPPNVACVAAAGLFAGCHFGGWRAYLVPLAALGLSDWVGHIAGFPGLGFYHPVTMLAVYGGMLASVPIGRWLRGRSPAWVPAGSLAASSAFFLVSNFGVWLAGWYSLSLTGLVATYAAAVPFFGLTVAGDFVFSAVLFGVWEVSRGWSRIPLDSRRGAPLRSPSAVVPETRI